MFAPNPAFSFGASIKKTSKRRPRVSTPKNDKVTSNFIVLDDCFKLPEFPRSVQTACTTMNQSLDFRTHVELLKAVSFELKSVLALYTTNAVPVLIKALELFVTLGEIESKLGTEPIVQKPTPTESALILERNQVRSEIVSLKDFFSTFPDFGIDSKNVEGMCAYFRKEHAGMYCSVTFGFCPEEEKVEKIQTLQSELQAMLNSCCGWQGDTNFDWKIMEETMCTITEMCKVFSVESLQLSVKQTEDIYTELKSWANDISRVRDNIDAQHELNMKKIRAEEILVEVDSLKSKHKEILRNLHKANGALLEDPDDSTVERLHATIAKLESERLLILAQRDGFDEEMRHLCGENFPDFFHRVTLDWQEQKAAKPGQQLDRAKALLLKSNLLLPYDETQLDCILEREERMNATLPRGHRLIQGAVILSSQKKIVLKRVVTIDSNSVAEITRMRRALFLPNRATSRHNSILLCMGAIMVGNAIDLCFPYMPGGDLAFWTNERVRSPWRKRDVLTQVADALVVLHAASVYHRDIKPWNILMDSSEDDAVPKLTDFEHSKQIVAMATTAHTVGVRGTTEGFRAPEIADRDPSQGPFSAEELEKQDVYSFGATAAWVLDSNANEYSWTSIPKLRVTIDACLHKKASERCTSLKLKTELSTRNCEVCGDCEVLFEDCVMCPAGQHFMCKETCFKDWVVNQCTEDVGKRTEEIGCFACPPEPFVAFPSRLLAPHFDVVLKARVELAESKLNLQNNAAKKMDLLSFAQAQLAELLTPKCPNCERAFLDFEGCCALTCAGCNIQFCAFCHGAPSANAHSHVRVCELNPNPRDYFCSKEQYSAQQKTRKAKLAQNFLATLDPQTKKGMEEFVRKLRL